MAGARLLELDCFEPLRLRSNHTVEPLDLFFEQNIDRAFFRKPLIVHLLEFLERTHQLGVRHGSIGGNAGFRFERSVSFNFHLVLLLDDKRNTSPADATNVGKNYRCAPRAAAQDEIVEDALKLSRQRHAVKDYYPINQPDTQHQRLFSRE